MRTNENGPPRDRQAVLTANLDEGSGKPSTGANDSTAFAYSGPYLEQFPKNTRSLIVNMFCFAVRNGARTVDQVLDAVDASAWGRIVSPYATPERADIQRRVIESLNYDEARAFARFILQRERLTPDEKERRRAVERRVHARQWMEQQPPTERQIAFLKSLGCERQPKNRLEAGELISDCLRLEGGGQQ